MKPSRATTIGFTLIELMVTIAIVAIMLVVAAPSFRNFIRNSELTSLTNKLLAAINAARSEAMKYGQNALVIPANGGNDWTQGWIVFVDSNRNNSYDESTDVTIQNKEHFRVILALPALGMPIFPIHTSCSKVLDLLKVTARPLVFLT